MLNVQANKKLKHALLQYTRPSASKDYSFIPGPDPVRLKIILLNQDQNQYV